jgi:hypothetical protein
MGDPYNQTEEHTSEVRALKEIRGLFLVLSVPEILIPFIILLVRFIIQQIKEHEEKEAIRKGNAHVKLKPAPIQGRELTPYNVGIWLASSDLGVYWVSIFCIKGC